MCKYAYLKALQDMDKLTEGVRNGIIKVTDVNNMRIFEDWLDLSATIKGKEDRKVFVSVQNNCSKRTVERVIKDFSC